MKHASLLAVGLFLAGLPGWAQSVLWLEAEDYADANGTVQMIEPATGDYGPMARAEASGERFLRLAPGAGIMLRPVSITPAGLRTVWVRAFPMAGRRVTVGIDGVDVGTSPGEADTIALVWHRLGQADLAGGDHAVSVRAAAGNTALAYVDAVALLTNPEATPYGRSPEQVLTAPAAERLTDEFSVGSVSDLAATWALTPPPGADALVEMLPSEDGGALHIHNGAGQPYSLVARQPLRMRPGEQVTVRLRARKKTLCETLSVSVGGVGTLTPQLYTRFTDYEQTWLVPPGLSSPALVRLDGRAGGDTYISRIEVFRPDPPVSAFATGRFIPRLDNQREGRLFEVERYVVNAQSFAADVDRDGDGVWSLCRLSQDENEVRFSRGTCLKSDSVAQDRSTPGEGCPPLHVRVGPLEPGRYQVYLSAPGRAIGFSRDGQDWTRLSGNASAAFGLVAISEPFFEFWLDDRYAEPGNPGPTYVDTVRFMPVEDPAYTMAPVAPPSPLARGSVERRQVPLTVANSADCPRAAEPVVSGVPIPMGELVRADQARLLDGTGTVVPCRITGTGLWPDGSVKWLLLDFQASVPAAGSAPYVLEYGSAVAGAPLRSGLVVTRGEGRLQVDTGPATFLFAPASGVPWSVTRRDAQAPAFVLDGLIVADDGRQWSLSAAHEATTLAIEEESPFRIVVRWRGRFAGDGGAGPIAFDHRTHLFAGRAEALIEYGIVPTEAEETIPLRRVCVRLNGNVSGVAEFVPTLGQGVQAAVADRPRLVQTGASAYGNRGAFPCAVRSATGAMLAEGEKALGILRMGSAAQPLLVCLPHFWEQFPKALGCTPRGIEVDLWPDEPGVPAFVAHAGSAKSHRIGVSLSPGAGPHRWLQPLMAVASPEWYCASGAFEGMVPRRKGRYAEYEAIVDEAFAKTQEERAGYGMEDWGDVWQEGYVAGARTWSNQEWDLVNNWLIPFVRTGDRQFLEYAHEAARHFADVDCIHHHRSPAWVGGSWMHAHTSLVGHQLEPPNFAHAGWTEGMLNLYHLTGDRRGLEASLGIADWIARHAPQRDELPAGGPPYNLHIQRPAGWPLTTLCLAYRETRRPEYLQTARRIVDYARRCQEPDRGAWDAQVGHEVPYRGGCVFAYTLLRGLRLYADITGEERAKKDYVDAARWILSELWRPGHRYLYEQCPLHEPGTRVPFTLAEMAGYATRLSGDPMFVAIGHDAFCFNTSPAQAPSLVNAARRSQWGNGILTQAARLLYEWERAGLAVPEHVTLTPGSPRVSVPGTRPREVALTLHNGSAQDVEGLVASCLVRGDWRARVVACPERLATGAEGTIVLLCEAPPPVMQYALQNDLAHVHVLARYRQGSTQCATWAAVRLDIAPDLALSHGWPIALKPGTRAEVVLDVADGVEAQPTFACRAACDLPDVAVSVPEVIPAGPGTARVRVTLSAARGAALARGHLTLDVRSGPRRAGVTLEAEIGRFRALLIESPLGEEWRSPFNALHVYPGIAAEFMAPARLTSDFPESPAAIAERWETVAIGDTGTGAAAFRPAQLQALAEFVRSGGGLLTVGGATCYTPGGYDRTPLADLLPVVMADGSYRMGPATVDVLKPQARFFEGYEPAFPTFGAHHLLQARPGAMVVAAFDDGTPFLALGSAGKGRVLALGAIWNHGSGAAFRQWREYGRFVGRCVRWTAGDLDVE